VRNDAARNSPTPPRSRRTIRASFADVKPSEIQRAQGMPGARRTAASRAKNKKHTSVVTTVTPDSPGIPRAMVLTVSSALSPVIGLCCHCHRRDTSRQLDASVEASGPHDFAVRFGAVRQQHIRVHRIPSRVRDDREPPLVWDETKSLYCCFYPGVKRNFGNSEIVFS
jgi:hypothetical protein